MKQCPFCHAAVESDAPRCKFCGVPLKASSASMQSPVKDEIPPKDSYAKVEPSFKTEAVQDKVSSGTKDSKTQAKRSLGVTLFAIYLFFMGIRDLLNLKNAIFSNTLFHIEKIKLFNMLPYGNLVYYFINFSIFSVYIWGLCALFASIGLFLLKEWARKLTVIVSILVVSLYFLNLFLMGGLFITKRAEFLRAFSEVHIIPGVLLLFLVMIISLLVLLFYGLPAFFFTRAGVKERFLFEGTKDISLTRKDLCYGIPLILLAIIGIIARPDKLKTNKSGMESLFGEISSLQKENKDSKVVERFKIEGILYSKDNPSVMIDGKEYYLNEFINGGKITHISPYEVTVEFQEKQKDYQTGDIIKPPK